MMHYTEHSTGVIGECPAYWKAAIGVFLFGAEDSGDGSTRISIAARFPEVGSVAKLTTPYGMPPLIATVLDFKEDDVRAWIDWFNEQREQ